MMAGVRTVVRAADSAVAWIERAILLIAFLLLAFVTGLQIVSRELALQTTWTLEVGGYLLVWLIFAGASLGVRHWKHVRFDALALALPESVRRPLERFAELVVFGFALFLVWTSSGLVERQVSWGQMTATLPANISIGAISAIMPLAGGFMLIHLIHRFLGARNDDERR